MRRILAAAILLVTCEMVYTATSVEAGWRRSRARGCNCPAVTAPSTPVAAVAAPVSPALFNGNDLSGWRVADTNHFENHGPVKVVDGAISLGRGKSATGISYAGKPPTMDYEISLEARRIEGDDFFCGLTFPVSDTYLSLIIGGWGGGVTGISNIDGFSAVENSTTGYLDVKNGQWYRLRLRVTEKLITAWIDDKEILKLETEGRKLSIWWEQEPMRPIGIATWNTAGEVRKIELKKIGK